MTEIVMPTSANLVQFALSLDDRKQVNRAWSGKRKVSDLPGAQLWKASFSPHEIYEASVKKEWRVFLISLHGQSNTFRLKAASAQHNGANPTISAGANAGATIPLQGLPANTMLLEKGDYMTVPLPSGHHRFVMLESDLVSNGAGQAVADFWPYLNEVPTQGVTVETIDPFVLLARDDDERGWSEDYGVMTVAFSAEEAL